VRVWRVENGIVDLRFSIALPKCNRNTTINFVLKSTYQETLFVTRFGEAFSFQKNHIEYSVVPSLDVYSLTAKKLGHL